jgi:hypothetical protein
VILFNLSTEAEVANGTRGTVTDIILDPREGPLQPDEEDMVKLTLLPALIVFKPDGGSRVSSLFRDTRDYGIQVPEGHIPLTACTVNFPITMPDSTRVRIGRWQYPLTGGYSFTDIKSQGQTIEVLVADLRNTPTGKISPFSAYVTLSRSRGRQSI